jgi:hypothetical protein
MSTWERGWYLPAEGFIAADALELVRIESRIASRIESRIER